jgi:hypothetical protein
MVEIFRSRDCVVFYKDDAYTVAVDDTLVSEGWVGGQGVQWVASSSEFTVTRSIGFFGGFLVWGSDEDGDRYTAVTQNQLYYRFATMLSGACLISTSTYEQHTWSSRQAGPLVPNTFAANQKLYLSLRGYWTPEDELSASGHPSAPAPLAGVVARLPKAQNGWSLGIQTVM